MNILVNGGSGFIGSPLVRSLANHGYLGTTTGRSSRLATPAAWTAANRVQVLNTIGTGFDGVVHLEVVHHVARPTQADLLAFQQVNVEGVGQWLAWAAKAGVRRFVYVSSVKAVFNTGQPTYEDAPYETSDPYGRSKAAAEELVQQWAGSGQGRSAFILRFPPVYGPGNKANLAAFARQVIEGRPCFVGLGAVQKSVLGLANAVAAIEHSLVLDSEGCEVFNVADPQPVTVGDMAGWIAEACGGRRPRGVPRLAAGLAALVGDAVAAISGREFPINSRRLRGLTEDAVFPPTKFLASGFLPVHDTREGLLQMTQWLMQERGVATCQG